MRGMFTAAFWTPGWMNRYPLMESSVCRPGALFGINAPRRSEGTRHTV